MTVPNPRLDVTAIVLAGGRSTRFGSDKLAADVDGSTVLDRAIDAVAVVASDVLVVGAAHEIANARVIADPEPFGGPLQALAGALAETTTSTAIVVAGDMPSLVPEVLGLLVGALGAETSVDAAVLTDPRDAARRQPVPLAIRVEPARTAAAAALDAGDRSLVRHLGRLTVEEVPVERWLPLDPEARTLVDIDLPADIDRLRRGARDQRKR
jgi:molybdopterin-guanine dinucleotide biosynthesis protein A